MPEHSPAPTPHRAIYGFSFYLLFTTLLIIYLLWALLPTKPFWLSYLPDKYFAICVPMLLLVGISFFIFLIYPAINMSMIPNVDELSSVVDPSLLGYKETDGELSWELLHKLAELKRQKAAAEMKGTDIKPKRLVEELRFMDLREVNKMYLRENNENENENDKKEKVKND